MDLFDYMKAQTLENESPLASRMRPTTLEEVVGQEHIIGKGKLLYRAIKADKLGSIIFYGPPGLGKTTIACIIANEMNKNIHILTGPNLEKPGDIATVLMSIEEGDIVFIDEIHRINRLVEELLYPAMEDFVIDIKVGGNIQNKEKQKIIA